MPLAYESLNCVVAFINQAVMAGGEIDMAGKDLAALACVCKSPHRHALQAAAWRLRAHEERRRAAVADRRMGVITAVFDEFVDLDEHIPLLRRVRMVVAAYVERGAVMASLLRTRPRLRTWAVDEAHRAAAFFGTMAMARVRDEV